MQIAFHEVLIADVKTSNVSYKRNNQHFLHFDLIQHITP